MLIENGNVSDFSPTGGGWLVGFGSNFANPTLRRMAQNALAHTIGVKWMAHPKGDQNGINKPISDGCTLSILVSGTGKFRVDFAPKATEFEEQTKARTIILEKHGDFVIWGGGIHHRWSVEEGSTILTVRWVPIEHWNHRPE